MKKRFSVIETFHDFQLVDNVTSRSASMGDGVEFLDTEYLGVEVGTEAWRQEAESAASEFVSEYFEAYFPNLYNLVVYDSPDFADCYTVLVRLVSEEEQAVLTRRWHMGETWVALSMGSFPDHPQYGFSQWCHADAEYMEQIYKRISFLDLPQNVQAHIAKRLED